MSLVGVLFLVAVAAALPPAAQGYGQAHDWRNAAHHSPRPFLLRPPEARSPRGSGIFGHDAQGRTDPSTGHVYWDHEEFRMVPNSGKRSHLKFVGVQTTPVISVDEEASVAALHCEHVPLSLSLVLADGGSPHKGTHPHAQKYRKGAVVVGDHHWNCSQAGSKQDAELGPSRVLKQTGFVIKILDVHVHACDVPAAGGARPPGTHDDEDEPEADPEGRAPGTQRGTCIELRGQQAGLEDIFKDLDVEIHDEDFTTPHTRARRVSEALYKSLGKSTAGHHFEPLVRKGGHGLYNRPNAGRPRASPPQPPAAEAAQKPQAGHAHASKPTGAVTKTVQLRKQLDFMDFINSVGDAITGFISDVVDVVKEGVRVVREFVHEVVSVVKTVVKAVVSVVKTGLNALNSVTGGILGPIVKGVNTALDAVEYATNVMLDSVEAGVNFVCDVVELGAELLKCATGTCSVLIRRPNFGISFNFDETFFKQWQKFPPIHVKFNAKDLMLPGDSAEEIERNGAEISGSAEITLDPTEIYFWAGAGMKFKLSLKNYNLEIFSITKYAGVKAAAIVELQIQINMEAGGLTQIWQKEASKDFLIGPVLVTLKIELDFNVGIFGTLNLNWQQTIGGRIDAILETGIEYRNPCPPNLLEKVTGVKLRIDTGGGGCVRPVLGFQDDKPPSIDFPTIEPPGEFYVSAKLVFQPELALGVGLYKVELLEGVGEIEFGVTIEYDHTGETLGCAGSWALSIGITPAFECTVNVKMPEELGGHTFYKYKLVRFEYNEAAGNPVANIPIAKSECPGANAAGKDANGDPLPSNAPTLAVKGLSRSDTKLVFGWTYSPSRQAKDDIVHFILKWFKPNDKTPPEFGAGQIYIPVSPVVVKPAFLDAAQKYGDKYQTLKTTAERSVKPSACPIGKGLVMVFNETRKSGQCRAMTKELAAKYASATGDLILAGETPSITLMTEFAVVVDGMAPSTEYQIEVSMVAIDGTVIPVNPITASTMAKPPNPPGNVRFSRILPDPTGNGFMVEIAWDVGQLSAPFDSTKRIFDQVLITPARLRGPKTLPCKSDKMHRVPWSGFAADCVKSAGAPQPPDPQSQLTPPLMSSPFFDYYPTNGAAASPKVRIGGLSGGLVYKFEVAHMFRDPDAAGEYLSSQYSEPFAVQMPGLPESGYLSDSTVDALPFRLSVTRLTCGILNVSIEPSSAGFGAAVAALTSTLYLEITAPRMSTPTFNASRVLTIDYTMTPKTTYTASLNLTAYRTSPKKVAIFNFRLTARTTFGYDPTADAANQITNYGDRPCPPVSCNADLLDDIYDECAAQPVQIDLMSSACNSTVNDTAVGAAFCGKNGSSISLPAAILRRRSLRAQERERERAQQEHVHALIRSGRILLQSAESLDKSLPPYQAPPDNFEMTDPLPIEPKLMKAAIAAKRPKNINAKAKEGAEQRMKEFRQDSLDSVDPNSRLGRLMAKKEATTRALLLTPYSGKNITIPAGIDLDISTSKCPPDNKVNVTSMGRTVLSLCDYQIPKGNARICGQQSFFAVQLVFNVTETGMHRFDTRASGFPAVIEVKSMSDSGQCTLLSCTPPFRVDSSADGLAAGVISLPLQPGGVLAINIAAQGGNCSSLTSRLVLDIVLDMPYDDHIFVNELLQNDTIPSPLLPITAGGSKSKPAFLGSVDRAMDYAFQRIATSTAGGPVRIGVYLKGTMYMRNTTTTWSAPRVIAGAEGSAVYLRSYSGLALGPDSAKDTAIRCSQGGGDKGFLTLSHSSPLVVPLGLMIVDCGGNVTVTSDRTVDSEPATAAITVKAGVRVTLQNLVFGRNMNPLGNGGALAVLQGSTVTVVGTAFTQNGCPACPRGGAVAVLSDSHAVFINSTFSQNSAIAGAAVVVGSEVLQAGTVTFDGCSFKENTAHADSAALINPSRRYGGAIALVRSWQPVEVTRTSFNGNLADRGAAIWATSALTMTASKVANSKGSAVYVSGAVAQISSSSFSDNYNEFDVESGGALTCTGASSRATVSTSMFSGNTGARGGGALVISGCVASFSLCSFERNAAMMGGGVSVGTVSSPAKTPTFDAGGATFTKTSFKENDCGGFAAPDKRASSSAATLNARGIGPGGGLLIAGSATPVTIDGCVFESNTAYMGGGIYAVDSVSFVGTESMVYNNTAGFPWWAGDAGEAGQVGGGLVFSPRKDKRSATARINKSTFAVNTAYGFFGGGIAIINCTQCELLEPVIIQNTVLMAGGQGGGLYMTSTNITADSSWLATANDAPGSFVNVYWVDEIERIIALRRKDALQGGRAPPIRSCYHCSPCQICGMDNGRCKFPSNMEKWCATIGKCDPDTCSFVTVGGARFDETQGIRSIIVDFDVPLTVNTLGTVTPKTNAEVNCSAIFTDPSSLAKLGTSARCQIVVQQASSTGRRLLATTQQLLISLGVGFTVSPATSLFINTAGLPAPYAGMSNTALVQVEQPALSAAEFDNVAKIANATIVAALKNSASETPRPSAGQRAALGAPEALWLALATLVAVLLGAFLQL